MSRRRYPAIQKILAAWHSNKAFKDGRRPASLAVSLCFVRHCGAAQDYHFTYLCTPYIRSSNNDNGTDTFDSQWSTHLSSPRSPWCHKPHTLQPKNSMKPCHIEALHGMKPCYLCA